VGAAIEVGTARVSKRLESLHWLQDRGLRTFGMICPSLPQEDYGLFSREACDAIRVDRCEHLWAEVINLRGESLTRTVAALEGAGLRAEAERLKSVSGKGAGARWEDYARSTFLAHAGKVPSDKLRFLQYVTEATSPWWAEHSERGAVLLGKATAGLLAAPGPA
jgi:DNA repair photolyase